MKILRILHIIILFFICINYGFSQSDTLQIEEENKYYSADNILRYADYLWKNKDYLRSAGEYQRYLFRNEVKNEVYALFKIAKCYRRVNMFDVSISHLKQALLKSQSKVLNDSLNIALSAVHFLAGNNSTFLKIISDINRTSASDFVVKNVTMLNGLYYLRNSDWKFAHKKLADFSTNKKDLIFVKPLLDIAERGLNIPKKSPTLAGILSAIIPGSGKIYADRTIDGLYSLLLVGGTSWLSYEGFRDHGSGSAKGWIFGGLSTFLYIGNIYGSALAVKLYNNNLEEKLSDEVQFQIKIWTHF